MDKIGKDEVANIFKKMVDDEMKILLIPSKKLLRKNPNYLHEKWPLF